VDKYLQQSLLYLRDSQAAMRQEALSFIGEPNPWVPLWALPWQQGTALQPPGTLCPCQKPQWVLCSGPPSGTVPAWGAGPEAAGLAGPQSVLLGACWGVGIWWELCT